VKVISEKVLVPNGIQILWGGGDPKYKNPERGANVADVLEALLKQGSIEHIGAIQRTDYAKQIPKFEDLIISYSLKLANTTENPNKPTFGGYSNSSPVGFENFMKSLEQHCVMKDLFPPEKIYPIAAGIGYLLTFPSMCSKLIVIVIPRAGFISLQELKYVQILLESNKDAAIEVYGILWDGIEEGLFKDEQERCKVKEIMQLLKDLQKSHPKNVFLVPV